MHALRPLAAFCFFLGIASVAAAQPDMRPNHAHYAPPPAFDQAPAPGMPLAPRLQNLGVHTFPVTTNSRRAQLFLNQGVNLAHGFNHPEAARAVAEAARLDPAGAMAHWRHAVRLGPNSNAATTPDH